MLRSPRFAVPFVVSLSLLMALVCGAAFAQHLKPAEKPLALEGGDAFALHDGIVVDPGRRMAFLLTPAGRLEAIALDTGSGVWTAAAAKPLLVAGDLLIAQAETRERGRLDLVSFDAASGAAGRLAARIDLPGSVLASLADAPGASFRVRAGLSKDKVVLTWSATKSAPAQGYLESAEDGYSAGAAPKSSQRLQGAAELDLASGDVRPIAKALASPPPMDVLTSLGDLKGRLYTSADGRHVLRSQRNPGGGVWQSYRWTIWERQSRELLGEITRVSSASPFVVVGRSLIFVAQAGMRAAGDDLVSLPLRLAAVDLASGETLWTKDASDPSFRGETPP